MRKNGNGRKGRLQDIMGLGRGQRTGGSDQAAKFERSGRISFSYMRGGGCVYLDGDAFAAQVFESRHGRQLRRVEEGEIALQKQHSGNSFRQVSLTSQSRQMRKVEKREGKKDSGGDVGKQGERGGRGGDWKIEDLEKWGEGGKRKIGKEGKRETE